MQVSHQLHTPNALTRGVEPEVQYTFSRRLAGRGIRFGSLEGKYVTPDISTRSLVTTHTELSRLP